MKYITLAITLLFSSVSIAQCNLLTSPLKASYEITRSHGNKQLQHLEMQLWRTEKHVAHYYPTTQITESWYLDSRQRIKPTRFFDAHKRAIEYQASETVHGKQEKDWSYRYGMISEKLKNNMTKVATSGKGCEKQETYHLDNTKGSIELIWLPELQLVKSFSMKKHNTTEIWTLNQFDQNKAEIDQFFAVRNDYQTTDFADIGDDHTDPFLTRMVTLGFIEHGASGFYDDKGHALEGGHHH